MRRRPCGTLPRFRCRRCGCVCPRQWWWRGPSSGGRCIRFAAGAKNRCQVGERKQRPLVKRSVWLADADIRAADALLRRSARAQAPPIRPRRPPHGEVRVVDGRLAHHAHPVLAADRASVVGDGRGRMRGAEDFSRGEREHLEHRAIRHGVSGKVGMNSKSLPRWRRMRRSGLAWGVVESVRRM